MPIEEQPRGGERKVALPSTRPTLTLGWQHGPCLCFLLGWTCRELCVLTDGKAASPASDFSPILSHLQGALCKDGGLCLQAVHVCPMVWFSWLHFTPGVCTHPLLELCLRCPPACTLCGWQCRGGQHLLSFGYDLGKEGGLPLHFRIAKKNCPKPSASLQSCPNLMCS